MTDRAALAVVDCAGVPIVACTPKEAAQEIVRLATTSLAGGVDVHLCNAYTLALADKLPELHGLLRRGGLNFPDGMSVIWANRWRHHSQRLPRERVYGPDLFLDVFALGEHVGLRHYLLGSCVDVLADLVTTLHYRFPRAIIVGAESPPFRDQTDGERAAQLERLHSSAAQVVWVGLGTPKQDFECARLADELPAVIGAVGAAFDFVAGHKAQAPRWMQSRGLEWLFRLLSEPRRLWRRYLWGNTKFIALALGYRSR